MSSRPPSEGPAPLWKRLRSHPRVADRDNARWRLADLEAKLGTTDAGSMLQRPRVRALVSGIADHSAYLWHLIDSDPQRFLRILADDPADRIEEILGKLTADSEETEDALMRRLRLAKQEFALLIALADLGGVWPLETVVQSLSRAADALIACALSHLLRRLALAGKLRLPDLDTPQTGCGLVVLGLGKLGGRELNYSSDVDLIVVFDPESPAIAKPDEAKKLFVRIVQDLVRLLQQPTAQGYVLRVDLRLRPDPGSTAVAISLDAAFNYYESFGQNWERAAMIKARPVAGDLPLGETFIRGLSPFIWRKYFDYAAIADIHAMKRQIHAAKGHAEIAVAGHNVKLGRGGIREIEFFVQTQQLIFGGKRSDLRGARTLQMLRRLRRDGWIGAHAVADLTRAYDFLRRIEHRLQMVADEQTHRLPRDLDGLERFARFCGFASADRFGAVLTRHLRAVVHHYRRLFEHAPSLDDPGGSLVFTGIDDDPETIETLAALGYKNPETVARTVREWHSGRRLAVSSPRARETLTDLVPKLLVTFSRVFDPDAAVAGFDKALDRMVAAGELFAILSANAALRTLFGDILGSAPRLAAAATLRPHLLDGVIDPAGRLCLDEDQMEVRAETIRARSRSTEDFLDAIRDFQHEEHFLIGVALLSGDLDPDDAGRAYAALAVGVVRTVLRQLRDEFELEHGVVAESSLAVLAMGKLGSTEMTATSDLDLVLLYAYDVEQPDSNGARPLQAVQYFGRLTKRLVSNLTVATRRGKLYDVDMRLRPSGRQGPLATKLSAFVAYQCEEAATWERMALTRARCIAGDAAFVRNVAAEIAGVFRLPPADRLAEDVTDMRARIEREKPAKGRWDLKLLPGGLIDIEFVAQYLVLRYANEAPEITGPATIGILRNAGEHQVLARGDLDRLIEAHRLFGNATQIMRLALEDDQSPDSAGHAVQQRIALATGVPDFARLIDAIASSRQAVRDIFRATLSPA